VYQNYKYIRTFKNKSVERAKYFREAKTQEGKTILTNNIIVLERQVRHAMVYVVSIAILACGYYSFTFGIYQWKKKNRLGGVSTMIASAVGTIVPIILLYIKYR